MQSSSVLIVHPSAERFPMASGKFGRHYSLDSPGSLTSPPGYDLPMMDHKPPTLAATATLGLSMPSSTCPSMTSASPHCFSQLNPHHLVYGTGHTGLPLISKLRKKKQHRGHACECAFNELPSRAGSRRFQRVIYVAPCAWTRMLRPEGGFSYDDAYVISAILMITRDTQPSLACVGRVY